MKPLDEIARALGASTRLGCSWQQCGMTDTPCGRCSPCLAQSALSALAAHRLVLERLERIEKAAEKFSRNSRTFGNHTTSMDVQALLELQAALRQQEGGATEQEERDAE